MKYLFVNDYSEGCAPEILKALEKYNLDQDIGYGLDKHSFNAAKLIKKACGHEDVDVHFIPGGSPCNIIAISLLRAHEAVLSCKSGHINVHEAGGAEHTGHKIIITEGKNGKVVPSEIEEAILENCDEHMVKPKMLYISQPTELGTLYSLKDLKELRKLCNKYNLYFFIDGARMGSALTSKKADFTLKDICDLADLFYIGGTKNGALLGEAMVIKNNDLKKDFRYYIKQNNSMLAKARILGICFEELFKDDLYFKLANHANEMADLIRKELKKKKVQLFAETYTNQTFAILKNDDIKKISKKYDIRPWGKYDKTHTTMRIVTSWATPKEKVLEFIKDLDEILA